jgi:hypothetical protein
MKKIRVGDVVVIKNRFFYGEIGEVIKGKNPNQQWTVKVSGDNPNDSKNDMNRCWIKSSWLHRDEFEVIDHIDEEEPGKLFLDELNEAADELKPPKFMDGYTGPKNYYDKEPNVLTKEDEQINLPGQVPLTINGMDVRAVIDPVRAEVVVICTNCKHIIKTIDLKK